MKKAILLTAAFLLTSIHVHAGSGQPFGVPVSFTIGDLGSLGYEWPFLSLSVVAELDNEAMFLQLGGDYSPTGKTQPGDGYSMGAKGDGFVKFGHVLVGGGGRYGFTQTSQWRKKSFRPSVGVGFEDGGARVLLDRIFSGTDEQNHLRGWRVKTEYSLDRRWRLIGQMMLWQFHQTNQPTEKRNGVSMDVGFAYRF